MFFQNFFQNLIPWLTSHGIKIVFILIFVFLINRFLKIFIKRTVERIILKKMEKIERKRADTLISVFSGTLKFTISILALLMILSELGVNIGPLLTGAGLLGLAVGMASREIIADFISGLFILLEDQFRVGEIVIISGIEGEVKEISLRKTKIKDKEGTIHLIPNSQIKMVSKKVS
jgi:small conductance mechanosensitive channel